MISIHYSNLKSFEDLHCVSVLNYCTHVAVKYSTTRLDNLVNLRLGSFVTSFKDLVKASPDTLNKIKNYYDGLSDADQTIIYNELDFATLYDYFNQSKKTFYDSSNQIYNSKVLAEKMDVCTCPYCNENFTYQFPYGKNQNKIRRTFDWDHLYPKKFYPFFAISFYNLIPSCKVCNFVKLDQNYGYFNPHLPVNVDDIYTFDIIPGSASFITNASAIILNINIKQIKYGQEIKNTTQVNGLLGRFRWHKELIKDIINKKRIYNTTYVSALATQLQTNSIVDQADLKKTIFGVFFSHEDYYKKPFSKLTNDILNNKTI